MQSLTNPIAKTNLSTAPFLLLASVADLLIFEDNVFNYLHSPLELHCYLGVCFIRVLLLALLLLFYWLFSDLFLLLLGSTRRLHLCAALDHFEK